MNKTLSAVLLATTFFLIFIAPAQAAPPGGGGGCGNGVCSGTENCSSCPADCGACPTTPICGNGQCQSGETCSSCSADCGTCPAPTKTKSQLTILIPSDGQLLRLGEKTTISAMFQSQGGATIIGALVNAKSDLFKPIAEELTLYDDGTNGDANYNDGAYTREFSVWNKSPDGEYAISVIGGNQNYETSEKTIKVRVNSTLTSDALLPLSNEYSKGSEITITGRVLDARNRTVPNSNVNITLSQKSFLVNYTTKTDNNGTFSYSYFITLIDPEGEWNVKIEAWDEAGNKGSVSKTITITTPPAGAYFVVTFLSPVEGTTYTRGQEVPITAEITKTGAPLTDANVSFRNPRGDKTLYLSQTTPGTYSTNYKLGWDDEVGEWALRVGGTKDIDGSPKAGATSIRLDVRPATLTVELLSPTKDSFTAGETVQITARATYPDGTLPEPTEITANLPSGQTTKLLTTDTKGTYSAAYEIKDNDQGDWQLSLDATDSYNNTGNAKKLVSLKPRTLLLTLAKYWWATIAAIAIISVLTGKTCAKKLRKHRIKWLKQEQQRITNLKKEAQRQYFEKSEISKATYSNVMRKYEEAEINVNKKLMELERRGKKQKPRT